MGRPTPAIVTCPAEVIDVPRSPRLVESLVRAINQQRPDAIIVGLPLNMDGTEGPAARSAREFAACLAAKVSIPMHFQDERLTSHAAEQHLNQSGRTHNEKKQLRDALAACEVLKDFLDGRG